MAKQSHSQKELLEKAVSHYQKHLHLGAEYLASRGLTQTDAVRHRRGVVAEPLNGHEQYIGRLTIPYLTKTGVVDLRFRAMGAEQPKYIGLPGATTHLYNVSSFFRAKDWIAVCEGEIDAITLDSMVGVPAIGVPGVNNWKKHYSRILQDFEKIYVFADGDQAGSDFAKNLTKELGNVTTIHMPEGEDVNSTFIKQGKDWFYERINNG
jgi:DNA primase